MIDNRSDRYRSAARALNDAMREVHTPFCIILHQDLILDDGDIAVFQSALEYLEDGDILGTAGTCHDAREIYTNTTFDYDRKPAGKYRVRGVMECDIVDECCFGGRAETFRRHPFSERICRHFHLYAAEQCLYAKCHGHHVYLCGMKLWHVSIGRVDMKFASDYARLCRAYRGQYPYIKTDCERSATDPMHCCLTWCKRLCKNLVWDAKCLAKRILHRKGRRDLAMEKARNEVWGI